MAVELVPQIFDPDAETLIPADNFFNDAKSTLPQVYLNATNFMSFLKVICDRKQYLYDIMRSLVNVYNLNSSDAFTPATPAGIYLKMLASNVTALFDPDDTDQVILNSVQNRIISVNSRGKVEDFYRYFAINGLGSYFTNKYVQEVGNATITMKVPLSSTGTPSPIEHFRYDMFKMKGAGIEIDSNATTIFHFAFFNIGGTVTPKTLGFGFLNPRGNVVGGGNYKSL